jgi:hypothetical protein
VLSTKNSKAFQEGAASPEMIEADLVKRTSSKLTNRKMLDGVISKGRSVVCTVTLCKEN